jgi:hypothetical protein
MHTTVGFASSALQATRSIGDYRVTIEAAPSSKTPRNNHHGKYFGHDSPAIPDVLVRSVSIHIGSNSYFLPSDLITDLGEPLLGPQYVQSTFTVVLDRSFLFVTMKGGDGAGGYTCRWRVDPKQLRASRSVREVASSWSPWSRAKSLIPAKGPNQATQIKLASREPCRTLTGASGPRKLG